MRSLYWSRRAPTLPWLGRGTWSSSDMSTVRLGLLAAPKFWRRVNPPGLMSDTGRLSTDAGPTGAPGVTWSTRPLTAGPTGVAGVSDGAGVAGVAGAAVPPGVRVGARSESAGRVAGAAGVAGASAGWACAQAPHAAMTTAARAAP